MKKNIFIIVLFASLLFSCTSSSTKEEAEVSNEYVAYDNAPAKGFDQEGSDLLATLLADKVMLAMGGRKAWDDTRYISWNFFGRRQHTWDRYTGNVRIEESSNRLTILMNIHSQQGKVQRQGEELTHPDSLSKYLDLGNRYWINDSYWLVMPYKLKDSGVTLTYLGEDTTQLGVKSDVLRLTFENVGVTPQNMYDVWVDVDSKLITQWAYYVNADQEQPQFITPWTDYKQYGHVLLAGNRGDYQLTDIQVADNVPDSVFTSF